MSEQLSVRGFVSALRAMEGDPVIVAVGCGAPEPTALLVGRLGTVREQGPPSDDDGVWWIPVGDRAPSSSYPGDESGFNLYESDVLAVTRPDPDSLHVAHGSDVDLTVHSPGATKTGTGEVDVVAPLSIAGWVHQYSATRNYSRTSCGSSVTKTLTDSGLQHDGGTSPSFYKAAVRLVPGATPSSFAISLLQAGSPDPPWVARTVE